MTSDEQRTIRAAIDPLDDLVLAVQGDQNNGAPDYELPPAVTLDQASNVLGLDPVQGLRDAQNGTYPVPVINVGPEGFRVGTAYLIKTVGLDKVRDALRVQG
ncbi:hypothetical protein ABT039_34630 [Streptomyces lasiicapitis]|uniref:hypothetical protein n=1 Tax=Streptomyces lasiicapitis TaxID=1923961 RepID=UPI00331E554E